MESNLLFETEEEYLLHLLPGDFIEWHKKMYSYSHKSIHYLDKSDFGDAPKGKATIVFLYVEVMY